MCVGVCSHLISPLQLEYIVHTPTCTCTKSDTWKQSRAGVLPWKYPAPLWPVVLNCSLICSCFSFNALLNFLSVSVRIPLIERDEWPPDSLNAPMPCSSLTQAKIHPTLCFCFTLSFFVFVAARIQCRLHWDFFPLSIVVPLFVSSSIYTILQSPWSFGPG